MPDEVSVFNGYTNGLAVNRKGNEGQMEDLLNVVQFSPSQCIYVPSSPFRYDMSTRSLSLYWRYINISLKTLSWKSIKKCYQAQKFKMAAEFKMPVKMSKIINLKKKLFFF
jgi:hypothetical protein